MAPQSSMPAFHHFGPDHLAALGLVALCCAALARFGRRAPERVRTAFVLFFIGHALVVAPIFWLLAAEGLRPGPGSALRAFAALNVYALVVGAIDWLTGWNYGYLRERPDRASLLDYMGPWPWYLAAVEVFAGISFALLRFPWLVVEKKKEK